MNFLIPNKMRIVSIQRQSTEATLQLTEAATPLPKEEHVLIKVVAAGVNRADIMQRQGHYPPPVGASPVLGLEVSGTIAALGKKVSQFQLGDKVCALVSGGGYASYCVADAGSVLPIPQGLDMIQAAALPETFFTVWSNLFERVQFQAGEIVLIQGGASGIGTTAIQLVKVFGGKVIATASSLEKCSAIKNLGADVVINYHTQDFVAEIEQFTDGKGVNVILDIIGSDYFPRHLQCLAEEGRLVQIGLQQGIISEINLLTLMRKRLTLTGSTLRNRDAAFKAKIAQQLLQRVWPLFAKKQIRPIIETTFPLANAAEAHQLMESNRHFGKIILTV